MTSSKRVASAQELRDAGFAADANTLPRDEQALRLLCAFNGVDPIQAPPGWWFHPNESSKAAWHRVLVAARQIVEEERQLLKAEATCS